VSEAATLRAAGRERFEYLLRLGDTSLVLGQRLGEWIGHAPVLEEDLGLANIALDLLGQARLLLSYAGELEGCGRDEDALAYRRDVPEFRNFMLVELPNADFGFTVVRQFLLDTFQRELYAGLTGSTDERLAGIAAKALKETEYHWRFSSRWVVRLGDGTAASHQRVQRALDELWPYTNELFDADGVDRAMEEAHIAPSLTAVEARWRPAIKAVIAEATLELPQERGRMTAGKRGLHGEAFGYLLAELQFLQRAYPGAQW
jgi:ring-1,2-phenylacetyl-CoA epoxidase subunit PaaC